nr:unnamed protein product [Callosobruchus chinensis]
MYLLPIIPLCVIFCVGAALSIPVQENEKFLENPRYLNYDELTNLFKKLETENPGLVKLHTIGRSVKNRELWALEINSNVNNRTLLTPMFKYVANMHGDEAIGRQLMVYLAEYLIYNYGKVDRVTRLVNSTDIYLMPSMNPDGYENSEEGQCESKDRYVGRENENHVDLNRDFPDQFEPQRAGTLLSGRQPETIALMTWIISRPFVLSGNLHGGAVVASYPFDDTSAHRTCCVESRSPDHDLFKKLALTYAENHPLMKKGDTCSTEKFDKGITNGAFWYEVKGGMQDFNYIHSNCFEVTFELSCCKFPFASELPQEWRNNKEPLLTFIGAAHWGVKGVVRTEEGDAVLDGDVVVVGVGHNVTTSNRGEYWRMLLPGKYEMYATAYGFLPSERVSVEVQEGKTTIQNFTLKHEPVEQGNYKNLRSVDSETYDQYGFVMSDNSIFKHHNYTALTKYLQFYHTMYPNITKLHSIGKSVQGRDLWVFVISNTPNEHVSGKPEFKYIANMHGNEVVGREMLLYLIKYLCERYGIDDKVTNLINNTRIHLLPSMNPDGYEISTEGDASSLIGRNNANNYDLNRNFPDQYGTNKYNEVIQPETQAVMDWTLSEPFVLSANLHNGALVANYPFDDTANGSTIENLSPDDAVFKYLAHVYANAHRSMHSGVACPMFPKEHFEGGITNGAKWYSVTGGMQDWNYLVAGCMSLTIEIGCFKFPYAKDLPQYWLDNREALVTYIEQVHKGVSGFVVSTIGRPIQNAEIIVEGIKHAVRSAKHGDYWRILLPGTYNITVAARGYESYTSNVTVPESGYVQYNVTLMKDDPLHWASAYDFGIGENQYHPKYHTNQEIYSKMAYLENKYPNAASFKSGEDYISMAVHSLIITDQAVVDDDKKFHIAVIGNLFATQPIGREIGIYLARHLLEGYHIGDYKIVKILKNTVVHLIPVIDKAFEQIWGDYDKEVLGNVKPDKYLCNNISADFKQVGEQLVTSRVSNHQDTKSVANALKHLLLEQKFDFILNIEGGSSGVLYPNTKDQIQLYKKIAEGYLSALKYPRVCNGPTKGTDELLTEYLYREYNAPMLTAKVSCCEYPAIANIPFIWRDTLDAMMKVISTTLTGVEGVVQNALGEPMLNATVRITGMEQQYDVTKRLAHFKILLLPGEYVLEVVCHNYQSKVLHVKLEEEKILSLKVVLQRGEEEVYRGTVVHLTHEQAAVTDGTMREPFKGSITTGIKGYVKDYSDHPVPNAKITILENNYTTFSESNGKYGIPLMPGNYTLDITASGYHRDVKLVELNAVHTFPKVVIVKLKRDQNYFGVPRLPFVLLTGFICASIFGLGLFCYVACKRRRVKYDPLSQYSFYEDFKDLDESKEKELFRTPLQKKPLMRPYYDDDDDEDENIDYPADDGTSSSDEEIVLLKSN